MTAVLVQYVIYQRPRDYPHNFVVRRWTVVRGKIEPIPDPRPHAVMLTLDGARACIPSGLACIPRLPEDDPTIVEVWT